MAMIDKFLWPLTICLGIFLVGMALVPFVVHEQACGATAVWPCFTSWLGAAGSTTGGIGVFLLIFDLRNRAQAEATASTDKALAVENAQNAALNACSTMTSAFVPDVAVLRSVDDIERAGRVIDVFRVDQRDRFKNEISAIRAGTRSRVHIEAMNNVERLLADLHEYAKASPTFSKSDAKFRSFVANCQSLKAAMAEIPDQILK